MNDFRNFTNKAAQAIQVSMELAAGYGHQVITPLHIMHSLIRQGEGLVASLLNKMERSPDRLAADIKTELEKLPKVSGSEGVYLSPEAQTALDRARKEAAELHDEYISTEHLFLGLLPDQVIGRLVNLDKQDVLKELAALRGNYRVTDPGPEGKFKVLEKYTHDLTKMAADGKIDPVIGRDEEIRRVMQIITRRTKNNPVLVGEPGTGKTAVVESLARKITDGDVPEMLKNKRLLSLDMGAMIAGTKYRGPTGVGKTELAKALAEFMFNDEKALIRIDMSEYMENFAVSRLVGSPPGYVGHEEGGQLTESVRRHPLSVILFDEIEKAHPDVLNIRLQMLDDGRLTDSKGRTIDFANTVIIMTSNIASREIAEHEYDRSKQEEAVNRLLKQAFKPEFLNRIDDIIIFQHLTKAELAEIVELQVASVIRRLAEKGIKLQLTKEASDYPAAAGYDHAYGARPLKRVIQRELLDELAFRIVEGSITEGDAVEVRVNDAGKLTFKKTEAAAMS